MSLSWAAVMLKVRLQEELMQSMTKLCVKGGKEVMRPGFQSVIPRRLGVCALSTYLHPVAKSTSTPL